MTEAAERSILITESAAKRVRTLIEMEGNQALMFRISVSGGGCSGFQYGFSLDDAPTDDDRWFTAHGVTVVVDDASLDLIAGCEVDFVDDLVGSMFTVSNPNATATCGCGTSFNV